jgi:hypothetical protein
MNKLDFADELEKKRTAFLFDDFQTYTSGTSYWTSTLTGTGPTVTNPNGESGVISLGNAASTANASAIVATTRSNWTFAAARPMYGEAQIQYTEAATSGCAIYFGFSSAFAAAFLADGTGVPIGVFSGAGIYKQFGDTLWRGIVSVGSTQQLTGGTLESSQPSPTTAFQVLRVQVDVQGANLEVSLFAGLRDLPGGDSIYPPYGGQQLRDPVWSKPLKLRVPWAGAAAMQFGIMVKQLNAASAETVVCDYLGAYSLRT